MCADDEDEFPWDTLLGFALVRLRISPEEFWSLSMPELIAAIAYFNSENTMKSAPMRRASFSELMKKFPDDRSTHQ